jgi:hypothetical protein
LVRSNSSSGSSYEVTQLRLGMGLAIRCFNPRCPHWRGSTPA